jgi:opacity protein-like surface antigen
MTTRVRLHVILLGLAASGAVATTRADGMPTQAAASSAQSNAPALSRLIPGSFDPPPMQAARPVVPDWIRRTSSAMPDRFRPATDEWYVALQQQRGDGADMLTLRYPLPDLGPFNTYAGAGLNRTTYYAASTTGATWMTGRNRHRALGAAAELGAELRLTDRLRMNADLRWLDLAADASVLRSADGLVGADPIALGVSLGWRFR